MPEGLIEGVFYEVSLIADGMAPGEAKAVASLKRVEDQAQKTGSAVDKATGSAARAPTEGAGAKVYRELEAAFKAGTISAEQFAKGANYLGGQFKVMAAEAIAAATGLKVMAAGEVAVATGAEVAAVATRGLMATLAPFLIAMVTVSTVTKLVKLAWDAMTSSAREAKQKVDELTESLLKNREAARPEDVKAVERLKAARENAAAAQARVNELSAPVDRGPGTVGVFIADAIRVGKLAAAQTDLTKKTEALTRAERELTEAQDDGAASQARRIAGLVEAGVASQHDIAQLKKHGEEARKELRLLASASLEGNAARQKLITDSLGDPQAIQKRREQLAGILKDANREAERLAAEAAKRAKADESAAGKGERHDERVQALVDRLTTLRASLTSVGDDNTSAMLQNIDSEIKALKPDDAQLVKLRALRNEIAELANDQNAEKIGNQLRDLAAASTVTAVDDLNKQLAVQVKLFEDMGASPEQIASLKAIQQPMVDVTAASEGLAVEIERIQRDLALGFNLKGNLSSIQSQIDKAIEARNAAPAGSVAQAKAQWDLDELLKLEVQLREKIKQLQKDAAAQTSSVAKQTGELAGKISDAAYAASLLAAAFLGVDSNITKALASIGELAAGISKAVLSAESGDILGTIAGVAQGIQGLIGLGSSILGEDPAVAAARKDQIAAMQQLKMALLELKDAYLQNVSTSQVQQDKENAEKIIAGVMFTPQGTTFDGKPVLQAGEGGGAGRRGTLRDIGEKIGKDFDSGALETYFEELDARYGTNLAKFVKDQDPAGLLAAIRLLPDALKRELEKLGGFGDTAAGVIKRVNFEFEALGKTNALEKFRATIKALEAAGIDFGEFADEFAKLADPATTAEEAAKIVADVVARLTTGEGINFGGLTPEEVRALLTQGAGAFRGEGEAAGTGGFNRVTTITEVTGSRIGALLSTANVFAEMTAANTAAIAQLLGGAGASVPPIPGPPVEFVPGAPVNTSSAGVSVTFEENSIQVNVQSELAGANADPEAFGRKIGREIIQQISQGLEKEVSWRKLALGNVVR